MVPRKESEMTLESTKPSTSYHPFTQGEAKAAVQSKRKGAARCRHFTADGTRCRLPILDTRSHVCFRHSALIEAAQSQHND